MSMACCQFSSSDSSQPQRDRTSNEAPEHGSVMIKLSSVAVNVALYQPDCLLRETSLLYGRDQEFRIRPSVHTPLNLGVVGWSSSLGCDSDRSHVWHMGPFTALMTAAVPAPVPQPTSKMGELSSMCSISATVIFALGVVDVCHRRGTISRYR